MSVQPHIENLVRKPKEFPYDGIVVAKFANSVHVRPVGSDTIKRDVALPAHIDINTVSVGMPVKMNEVMGKTTLLQVFTTAEMVNYSGIGSALLSPPHVTVTFNTTGWVVSWGAVSGADRYLVYGNTVDSNDGAEYLTVVSGGALTVTINWGSTVNLYFAVRCVAGLHESEMSNWARGYCTPTAPVLVVNKTSSGVDFVYPVLAGAQTYEIWRADNSSGLNAAQIYTGARKSPHVINTDMALNYWFRARGIGYDDSIGEYGAWVTDTTPPATPVISSIYEGLTVVRIFLKEATEPAHLSLGFSHYIIQKADTATPAPGDITTIATRAPFALATTFNIHGTDGVGPLKYYRLIAVDVAGNTATGAWVASSYLNSTATVKDMFDGYGGASGSPLDSLWWLKIATGESGEFWNSTTLEATLIKEGAASRKTIAVPIAFTTPTRYSANPIFNPSDEGHNENAIPDLSLEGRFTDADYMVVSVYLSSVPGTGGTVGVNCVGPAGRFDYVFQPSSLVSGWNHLKIKRSDFVATLTISWDDIPMVSVEVLNFGISDYVIVDDWRIVKADPADPTTYNDTGNAWDKATSTGSDVGEWHIYKGNRTGEPAKPYSYGQIKTVASPAIWYLSHKPMTTTIMEGTVQAGIYLKGANGKAGLAFYIKDVTAASWDMYAVELDSTGDTVKLVKWVAGTRTELGSAAFVCAPDQIVWLGVDFREFTTEAGRIKVFASLTAGNVIQASCLKISLQNTSLTAGGSVGLLSYQANVRFVDFTAGSPAHAEVADIAKALDGPIVDGQDGDERVYLSIDSGLKYSADKETWVAASSGGAEIDHTLLSNIGTNTHATIDTHLSNTSNPHNVTKAQLGLGSVDDTSDAGKPVSTAQATAIGLKVTANTAITGATKTKISYDVKGLVTSGADATQDDIGAGATYGRLTNTQVTDLTDAGDSALHYHSSDRARAVHTGSQAISTVTGLQTALDGKVVSVSGTLPVSSSGGTAPVITVAKVTITSDGTMSMEDKVKLNGIEPYATGDMTGAEILTSIGSSVVYGNDSVKSNDAANFNTVGASGFYRGNTPTGRPVTAGTWYYMMASMGSTTDSGFQMAHDAYLNKTYVRRQTSGVWYAWRELVDDANLLAMILLVDGATSGLDADKLDGQEGSYYLAATSYTASDVLAKLLTVDGSASGLDADKLDGYELLMLARQMGFASSTMYGGGVISYLLNTSNTPNTNVLDWTSRFIFAKGDGTLCNCGASIGSFAIPINETHIIYVVVPDNEWGVAYTSNPSLASSLVTSYNHSKNNLIIGIATHTVLTLSNGISLVKGQSFDTATHSSANADTLDGIHAAGFIQSSRTISTTAPLTGGGDLSANRTIAMPAATVSVDGYMTSTQATKLNGIEAGATTDQTASEILTAIKTVDGIGSGLDADTLDGVEASALVPTSRTVSTTAPLSGGGALSSNLTLSMPAATTGAAGSMSAADKTKLDGIQAGATNDQTAAEILTAIKTVDGASSGLDAELLIGLTAEKLGRRFNLAPKTMAGGGVVSFNVAYPSLYSMSWTASFTWQLGNDGGFLFSPTTGTLTGLWTGHIIYGTVLSDASLDNGGQNQVTIASEPYSTYTYDKNHILLGHTSSGLGDGKFYLHLINGIHLREGESINSSQLSSTILSNTASATPTASTIPIAGSSGKLDPAWVPAATPTTYGTLSPTDKTKLDGLVGTGSMTGEEIRTALLAYDGAGSGLDADKLDGYETAKLKQIFNGGTLTGGGTLSLSAWQPSPNWKYVFSWTDHFFLPELSSVAVDGFSSNVEIYPGSDLGWAVIGKTVDWADPGSYTGGYVEYRSISHPAATDLNFVVFGYMSRGVLYLSNGIRLRPGESYDTTTKSSVNVPNANTLQGYTATLLPVSTPQATALNLKLNTADYTAADVLAKLLTVDTDTSGLNANTLQGYTAALLPVSTATATALSGKQPLDADLTAIAAIAAASGLLKKTAADTWSLDTTAYITSAGAPVQSVAGRTGAVTLAKGDVGLGNVDDTTDAGKPVSTAQATAIGLKVTANAAIVAATKTKISYDAKGLVTSGADATQDDIGVGATYGRLTNTQVTDLTDAGDSVLHYHAADRNRAVHSGTQAASTISDFAATVRTTVITGVSFTLSRAILASDTVLEALGYLQAQATVLMAHLSRTDNPHTVTKAQVGLSNVVNTAQVTQVTGTAPISATAGTAPAISISAATGAAAGSMSAADKTKLDAATSSVVANAIVTRDANGYVFGNYFKTTANDVTTGVTQVMVETGNDNYIRHGSAAAIREFIGTTLAANLARWTSTGNSATASGWNVANNYTVADGATAAGTLVTKSGNAYTLTKAGVWEIYFSASITPTNTSSLRIGICIDTTNPVSQPIGTEVLGVGSAIFATAGCFLHCHSKRYLAANTTIYLYTYTDSSSYCDGGANRYKEVVFEYKGA